MTHAITRRWLPLMVIAVVAVIAVGCGQDAVTTGSATVAGAASSATTPAQTGAAPESTATAVAAGANEGTSTTVSKPKQWSQPPSMQLEAGKDYGATLHTSMGDIVVDLDEQGAPKTVNNFVFLAEQGFYTNVPFHRVIKGFMIQTGDPTGTGAGGPGYRFADEPITKNYTQGTLAMANAGPNTNGSQFFICQVDNTNKLQKNYTIFGNVVSGQDVVDAIANAPVKASRQGEMSSPVDPITLLSVDITTK
jgi:cyclophilin family peptidyl-prolyl cis-trans isomerase